MKKVFLAISLIICTLISCQQNKVEKNTLGKETTTNEVTFYTKDSIKVFGDLHIVNKTATTLLIFHQGGSNTRGEYKTIIPVLVEKGLNVLAIDQRVGGQVYGNYNRTVANMSSNNFNYCDAYPDLEAALNYILENNFSGKKIVWGSSYSGSLAVKLANQYQDKIDGVLAFSPASGGPLQPCKADNYFETLKLPLLLLRPKQEMQRESSKNQFALAKENGHQTYIAENGVHGSSLLVKDRVQNNTDKNWNAVFTFLNKIKNE